MRIGEFAKLSRVSVKTLRHYDELGLIRPVHVDGQTGYRQYGYDQYPVISRIRALKDLGFSLEEIGRLLSAGMSNAQMRAMFDARANEITQRMNEDADKLARVRAWIAQSERGNEMSQYEVVVRRVPAMRTASLRNVVPQPANQNTLWNALLTSLKDQNVLPIGPCMTLYHDEEPQERDWDIEVSVPIADDLLETSGVTVRELPAVETMATLVHAAPFLTISDAYSALWQWTTANGYRVFGPPREVVLRAPSEDNEGPSQTDPQTVVELQFPVEKPAGG